jgi:Na+-transporting methylmalonyl-CoA/oxaloacetate decarboxylase gamma subunit
MEGITSNGGASIWGSITKVLDEKAQETVAAVTAAAVTGTLEQQRLSKGESKWKFYGRIALEWCKSHAWVFFVPTILVLAFYLIRFVVRKFKGKKSTNQKRW